MLYIDYNDFPEHSSNIIKLKDLRQIRRFGENAKNNNNFHRIEIDCGIEDKFWAREVVKVLTRKIIQLIHIKNQCVLGHLK